MLLKSKNELEWMELIRILIMPHFPMFMQSIISSIHLNQLKCVFASNNLKKDL